VTPSLKGDTVRHQPLLTAFRRFALLIFIVLVWWAASLTAPVYILPTPARVFRRIVELSASGDLPYNLITTLVRVLAGFGLAVVIGVP
jgi:NitT/TauT family transport system permease protein